MFAELIESQIRDYLSFSIVLLIFSRADDYEVVPYGTVSAREVGPY